MLYIRGTNKRYRTADEQDVIFESIQIDNRNFSRGETLTSPDKAKDCIKLKLTPCEHEVFVCLFLDNQHRVFACDELFRGTIDGDSAQSRNLRTDNQKTNYFGFNRLSASAVQQGFGRYVA